MAQKNCRGHLHTESVRLKKYLYVLHPLLAAQASFTGQGSWSMTTGRTGKSYHQ
ncbi:MAG: nucleotidyltransferase domain-containing protein [Zoogloeaceae bacterium]|nr:nucleotidyltransferase domain-containing protein [Zoogloeaceae bacterium]